MLYECLSSMHITCPTQLILFGWIILIIFGGGYKLETHYVIPFIQLPSLSLNIPLMLCSQTSLFRVLPICLYVRDQLSHPYKTAGVIIVLPMYIFLILLRSRLMQTFDWHFFQMWDIVQQKANISFQAQVFLLVSSKFRNDERVCFVAGILIFIGLFITFSHANAVVKREIAKQSRRSLVSLLLIVCNLLGCILFIYYLFQEQKLYLRYCYIIVQRRGHTLSSRCVVCSSS